MEAIRSVWRSLCVAVGGCSVLLVFLAAFSSPTSARVEVPDDYASSTIVVGLDDARDVVATPDGRLFVALGDGDIRVVEDDVLRSTPLISLSVDTVAQQGLHSVGLDEQFAVNGHIYAVFTPAGVDRNRVSRFTVSGDVADPDSEVVLVDLPLLDGANSHYGAAVVDAGDGTLLITVGDHEAPSNGQDTSTRTGSVLRLNKNGSIPNDNPFVDAPAVDDAIFAIGVRNPWQIARQASTGRIAISDVGGSAWEELNLASAGGNYGWADAEGAGGPGLEPLFAFPHFGLVPGSQFEGCAISGATFYEPNVVQLPSRFVGHLFVGDLCGGWIAAVDPETGVAEPFASGFDSLADIVTNPVNGALYVLDRNLADGRSGISKIEFVGDDVTLRITSQPLSQRLAIGQDASFFVAALGQGDLEYQWTRNGAVIAGATDALLRVTSVSAADDGAQFRATVSDAVGQVTSSLAEIIVTDNFAPTPFISQPTVGATYEGGQELILRGGATDAEDGAIGAQSLSWEVRLNHDAHDHGFTGDLAGVDQVSVTIPRTGETSANVWYTVYLTAVDSDGATTTVSTRVDPELIDLTLETSPAGGVLNVDGPPLATPISGPAVQGLTRTVRAPIVQELGGAPHGFVSWSDGGTLEHSITTPADNLTLTARYAPLPFEPGAAPSCTIVRFDGAALITFSGDLAGGRVQLLRGNSWLQTVTGRAYYVDADSPGQNASYFIRVRGLGPTIDVPCAVAVWPPDAPPPPDGPVCTGVRSDGGSTVVLTFSGIDGVRSQLRRDGDWLATVTGLSSYTDTAAGSSYQLRSRPDGVLTDTACTFEDAPPPPDGPVCTGVRSDGGSTVVLTFSGIDGVRSQLRRDGDWLATVTGLSSYTDTAAGSSYQLRSRPDGVLTDTACTIE